MHKLESLNRLSNVYENSHIKGLSNAIFPGTHCPMFGVTLISPYIENMITVIIGTSECTYYTKNFTINKHGLEDNIYSITLNKEEAIHGAKKEITEAILNIIDIEKPELVMIVTTCITKAVEIDYSDVKELIEKDENIPTIIVDTNHFEYKSHIPGMEMAITSLIEIMETDLIDFKETNEIREISNDNNEKIVNILGYRHDHIEKNEVVRLLQKNNIKIGTVIPAKCSVLEIKNATNATLNIVTDIMAIELAEQMQQKFNIPYIYFDKHTDIDVIISKYKLLENFFEINLLNELENHKEEYEKLFKKCKELISNKKFIYGTSPMLPLELSSFLTKIGLEPSIIQIREINEKDILYRDVILNEGKNPYISQAANNAAFKELYNEIKADLFIGYENPMLLRENGIKQVILEPLGSKLGIELPIALMEIMLKKLSNENEGE